MTKKGIPEKPEPRLAPSKLKVHPICEKEDSEHAKPKKGGSSAHASPDLEDNGLEILGDTEDEGSGSERGSESSSDGEEGKKAGKAAVDTDNEAELGASPLLL